MRGPIELEFASSLDAPIEKVWRHATTMKGVNFELHPFLHMTSGRDHRVLPTTVTSGTVLFRSWLVLFCVLPFDRHSLALAHIDEGEGFVEESTSWLQRRWRHERRLRAAGDRGCVVTDRLVIEPRLRPARPIVALIVRRLFEHRHRRLERRFGVRAA